MTAISTTLRSKIERRAKRAWRRHRDGNKKKVHRVTDVTDTELMYRLPYTPDYYGAEKIKVVCQDDGTVVIDPKTTGLIDCLNKSDLGRLEKHGDTAKAYLRSTSSLKVGDQVKSTLLVDRKIAIEEAMPGDRVYVVEFHADDITHHSGKDITISEGKVIGELDQVKDLGFTVGGLLDLRTNADVKKLKKHIGKVRAYKYTDKNAKSPVQTSNAILYEPGKDYEEKGAVTDASKDCAAGINVASVEWCQKEMSADHRAFAFEFDSVDVAAIPTANAGKLRVFKCRCIEELDRKKFKPLPPKKVPKALPGPSPAPGSSPTAGGVDPPEDTPEKGFFGRLFGG